MQTEVKRGAQLEFDLLKEEAFVDDHGSHPTAKDAALSTQCDSPAGFGGSGLARLCCAAGLFVNCPDFDRPSFQLTATDSIKFFLPFFPSLLQQVWCGGSWSQRVCIPHEEEEQQAEGRGLPEEPSSA